MSKYLVCNPGSTATKFKVFSGKSELLESQKFTSKEKKEKEKFLKNFSDIEKIGIRVVHGGDLSSPVLINKKVLMEIQNFSFFAPIHNPLALQEISLLQKLFPSVKIYAFFDTDFGKTIPEELSLYPTDLKLAKKYKIRKYGFHGLVVQSLLQELEEKFKKEKKKMPSKIIFAHLGGGTSVIATKNKKALASSMGLSPNSGVMMKTRSGDVDIEYIKLLLKKEKYSIDKVSEFLSFSSGFSALCGSEDTEKIIEKAKRGSKKEALAYRIYLKQIAQKIGSYAVLLQGFDLLVLSGGIGFNNKYIKKDLLKELKLFALKSSNVLQVQAQEEKYIFKKLKKIK